MFNLKGKTAIVTGASRGIGLSVANTLAKSGCNIVLNYFGDEKEGNSAKNEVEKNGVKCIAVHGNIAVMSDCENLVKKAIEEFGNVDILVNNAGITKDKLMMQMTEEDFDAVINVNLKGSWNMMKQVTRPMMKQRSGRIINISSVVALMGNAGQVNYVASKAGVIGMTKSLAKEIGKKGVTVNAVAPGFINTPMTDVLSDEVKQNYKSIIPLNKFGEVEDIANLVAFLASDMAGYITGQTISVNGGMYT